MDDDGRRSRRWVRVRLAPEDHAVTNFELFFDLVFVFAITQVTVSLSKTPDLAGLARAVLLLAIIWWSWSAYAWLGNQARADEGVVRAGMFVAMTAIFTGALAIPQAWNRTGRMFPSLVLAVAFIVVRLVHTVLYFVAAGGDPGLRRQLVRNLLPTGAGIPPFLAGAVLGGVGQTALWAVALLFDWGLVLLTSRGGGGWRLHSLDHWVDRFGAVVIIALGESVVAAGAGAVNRRVDGGLVADGVLGVLVCVALWWLYFNGYAEAGRTSLFHRQGTDRVRAAISSYTYLHYAVIAGVVISAFGVRTVIARTGASDRLGGFAAGCLCLGLAAYLAALGTSWSLLDRRWRPVRLVAAAVMAATWPLAASVPTAAALALVLAVLVVTAGAERRIVG